MTDEEQIKKSELNRTAYKLFCQLQAVYQELDKMKANKFTKPTRLRQICELLEAMEEKGLLNDEEREIKKKLRKSFRTAFLESKDDTFNSERWNISELL
jgi:aspartate aminotransferase-like enzyme